VVAGDQASVWLYGVNETSEAVTQEFQRRLSGRLSWASGTANVDLSLAPEGAANALIGAGGFVKREYVLTIPKEALGKASLAVDGFSPLTLNVAEAAVAKKEIPRKEEPKEETSKQTAAVVQNKPQFGRFLSHRISAYEPIFIIIGTHPSVEFQFSMKARLFDNPDWGYFANSVFFGYTQTSFWDLLTPDPAFYDTSYRPTFFFYEPNVRVPNLTGSTSHLDVQYGYEHESNGQGGLKERSLNTLYFQPTLTLGQLDDWHITFQPRVWYYLSIGKNAPDLAAYKGYVNLRTMLTKRRFQVSTRFTLGSRGDHASGLLDLTAALPKKWGWDPALQIEAFRGYGQNLLDYNKIDNGLRAGFNLWNPTFDEKPEGK
jgi:outer membrane phospholipase A